LEGLIAGWVFLGVVHTFSIEERHKDFFGEGRGLVSLPAPLGEFKERHRNGDARLGSTEFVFLGVFTGLLGVKIHFTAFFGESCFLISSMIKSSNLVELSHILSNLFRQFYLNKAYQSTLISN
jgi:hypothetical protein